MRYTVAWETPACYEQIDELVAAGVPASEIRRFVHEVLNELTIDPEQKGVALSEGLRKLNLTPFRAYFFVDETNKRVTVTVVHWQP